MQRLQIFMKYNFNSALTMSFQQWIFQFCSPRLLICLLLFIVAEYHHKSYAQGQVIPLNLLMKTTSGAKKLHDFLPRDEVILGQKDRRSKVTDKQLFAFPYNAIGWIRSRQKNSLINDISTDAKGTGFLISQSLVLTSSHNFVIRDENNGKAIEYVPVSFCTLQPGKDGLVEKFSRIKVVKLNFEFIDRLSKIVMLKNMYYDCEGDSVLQQKYLKKILGFEEETVPHDFALLKLEQPIKRSQYFELFPNLFLKSEVAVTGYVHHQGTTQFQLFTHSNFFDSISSGGICYDIDTKAGQSGCPVYLKWESNKIVGIHKAFNPITRLNFATMITETVIETLKSWAQQMGIQLSSVKLNQNSIKQISIIQINDLREKGDQLRNQAQFEEALSYYKKALSIAEKTNGRESVEYANTLSSIGGLYRSNYRFQESLEFYVKELKIYEIIIKNQPIYKANVYTNISIVQKNRKDQQQANKYYRLAIDIYQRIGTQSIKCPYILRSIGLMYDFQRQTTKALEYYERALVINEKTGKDSINWANTLSNIGIIYYNQGKLKQALQYYDNSVKIYEKIRKESIDWAKTLNNLGLIYHKQNQHQQALEYYNRALKIYEKLGNESIDWANTIYNIGIVSHKQGKFQQTLHYYRRAVSIHEKIGNDSIEWANTLNSIGMVYTIQSMNEKGSQFYTKSQKMKMRLK